VTLKFVHVVKFVPVSFVYGQVHVQRMDLSSLLQSIDTMLAKMEKELREKIQNRKVVNVSLTVSPVVLGQLSGLLIIMYAVVEDS